MKFSKIIIPLVISLLVGTRSASQQDEVLRHLKEANETLDRANRAIDSILYAMDRRKDSMFQHIKFIGFDRSVADSLSLLFARMSRLLTRVQYALKRADSTGGKLDIAENMLIETATGDSLFNHMMHIYDLGIKYGDSTTRAHYIFLKKYTKENWLNLHFKKVPTVAAETILSKFRNEMLHLMFALMTADLRELMKKISSE